MHAAPIEAVSLAEAGTADQDRCCIVTLQDACAIVVADGAGGTSGGREAAETVVQRLRALFDARRVAAPAELAAELSAIDSALRDRGQTTAVVVVLERARLFGASVGDSGAWWLTAGGHADLTGRQQRKPLLGSGAARPVMFEQPASAGTLLVATDGLLKYAPAATICALARGPRLAEAARGLLESVRLRSGKLQDDVAVVLARSAAVPRLSR